MQLEEAVYQVLKNDAGIAAIVAGRIFAFIAPQTLTYPAVVYRPPADGQREVLRVLEGGNAYVKQVIHVFSSSTVKAEAARLDQAVNTALDEYDGVVVDPVTPTSTLQIESIFSTSLSHAYIYDDVIQVHQFLTQFECHYLDPLKAI